MRVLLFDLYTGGHHLEFASRILAELRAIDDSLDIDVLFPAPTPHDGEYFVSGAVEHLYDRSPLSAWSVVPDREPLPTVSRFVRGGLFNNRWRVLGDVRELINARDYDLVHCLEVDKIASELSCVFRTLDVPVVGTVNGVFFKPTTAPIPLHDALRDRLSGERGCRYLRWMPPALRKGSDWDRWSLTRCLETGAIDHLTVPSALAKRELLRTGNGHETTTTVVPDPVEHWAELGSKSRAREELGLPEDALILLSFGRLVEEKGIQTLCEALRRYEGPAVTVVLAGQPVAIDTHTIEHLETAAAVTVISNLGYIQQSNLKRYFAATDGVVIPYHRSFGDLRSSNVFNKATAAERPVIASDLGVIGQRVREHDLGLLVDPEDPDDLADAIKRFVEARGQVHNSDTMRAYAGEQTFETFARRVSGIYRTVSGTD